MFLVGLSMIDSAASRVRVFPGTGSGKTPDAWRRLRACTLATGVAFVSPNWRGSSLCNEPTLSVANVFAQVTI